MANQRIFCSIPTVTERRSQSLDDATNFAFGGLNANNVDPAVIGLSSPNSDHAFGNEISSFTTAATSVALKVDDTSDHVISSAEAIDVTFTVSGLKVGQTATVTFTDGNNQQVSVNVSGDGSYSANLSSLDDGTITSSLSSTNSSGHTTTASGNAVTLDTDSNLTPTLAVNAANPTHVTFTVNGLEGDETGTVIFADTNGHQDVVPIASNGSNSANLSNLADGTITYLLSVTRRERHDLGPDGDAW